MSGEHKPGTLFERHPRPWKVSHWPVTYIGSIPHDYVEDANGKRIAGDPNQPWLIAKNLVDIINADAPKPFVPGWYWYRDENGRIGTSEIITEQSWRLHLCNGWTLGPRIEKPEF